MKIKKNNKLLVCTFSGGRTSAFMARFLNEYDKYKNYDKVFLFANTGKEKEETLEFINKCDIEFNLNLVWLEAEVQKSKGDGTTFKIVDFNTASRDGEPFKDMIKKYGLPNTFASICTRELKQRPLDKYKKYLKEKYKYTEIITAIGIRYDERHRKSIHANNNNYIYPLCDDIKVDNQFIRNFWDAQCFDLQLKDYQGNCDLCFKKSMRKRLTMIKENPKDAEWWIEMENKYSNDIKPRFDLRQNKTYKEQLEMSKLPFKSVEDQHELRKKQVNLFDNDMDFETDCFCKAT
tara:strand:- start:1234 stop:2106 length:873 start_codon:yes stop_codon:yes gene_type:complete